MRRALVLPLLLVAACIVERNAPPPACAPGEDDAIDLDQSFAYTPGVDAGYYITYVGAGRWHLEWTCDTRLSAIGCGFSGSIIADAPPSGPNATCFQCEPADTVASGAAGPGQMEIDWSTDTTTGVDGVDFTSVPGRAITLDLDIDGEPQADLVYFVSGNVSAAPACVPFALTPPNA